MRKGRVADHALKVVRRAHVRVIRRASEQPLCLSLFHEFGVSAQRRLNQITIKFCENATYRLHDLLVFILRLGSSALLEDFSECLVARTDR